MRKLKEHIDKAGIMGVIFSHLCCIGLGTQVSLIAPTASGFLTNHKFFMPFLFLSLAASNSGIFFSYLRHKNIFPFLISVISSAIIVIFSFIIHDVMLLYMGMAGLIGTSIYNMVYTKKIKK